MTPPNTQPPRMSPKGRQFLEDAEACRLAAYQDSTGIWTIGVGHTGPVRGQAISQHTTISVAECDLLLRDDLKTAEGTVAAAVAVRAKPTEQHQIDALISFVFNAGMMAFAGSSLRIAFVTGDDDVVPNALFRWTRAGANATELATRRAREALMYSRGFYLTIGWKAL
jgi:lysozyme